MTPEQARALFNEYRKPGDMAHYGEKAAVAAIMEAANNVSIDVSLPAAERIDTLLAKLFPEWEADQRYYIALECAVAALSVQPETKVAVE